MHATALPLPPNIPFQPTCKQLCEALWLPPLQQQQRADGLQQLKGARALEVQGSGRSGCLLASTRGWRQGGRAGGPCTKGGGKCSAGEPLLEPVVAC